MLGAISGILASRSAIVFDTFQGTEVTFPPNLSAMPSTAKTFVVTAFPVRPDTGFGIALTQNITTFPVNPSTGFGIALSPNITMFPPVLAGPVISYDFGYVVLQMHFDGTNGSTTVADSSQYNRVATVGGTSISSAQSMFGGASLRTPASTPLTYASSNDFNISSSNFTIEFWAYWTVDAGVGLLCRRTSGAAGWVIQNDGIRGVINGTWSDLQLPWSRPSANTWHHYAITRSGTTMYVFIDGIQVGTKTGVTSIQDQATSLVFGQADSFTENRLNGYIDDFRFTNGLARYTANFTPPTTPFPNS